MALIHSHTNNMPHISGGRHRRMIAAALNAVRGCKMVSVPWEVLKTEKKLINNKVFRVVLSLHGIDLKKDNIVIIESRNRIVVLERGDFFKYIPHEIEDRGTHFYTHYTPGASCDLIDHSEAVTKYATVTVEKWWVDFHAVLSLTSKGIKIR